jgi:RNA polymerase sigma factor (TIGR02999 family)
MSDVTRILTAIERGDVQAADELLPIVYEELRLLAAQMLSRERSGQTLQATALVHEAYVRLVGSQDPGWEGRRHFFAAAAEAMRRILVDSARRKASARHGGNHMRIDLPDIAQSSHGDRIDLLALDEALEKLQQEHPDQAEIVKLRFFAGLSLEQTAAAIGMSRATVQRNWVYARAWLFGRLNPA